MQEITRSRVTGLLIDKATGEVIDAGVVTLHPSGHVVVDHGGVNGKWVAPYRPNANHAVLVVPPASIN